MSGVTKKDRESFEHLLRRFNRKVQQSGVLALARKKIRFEKEPTKRFKKDAAIRKEWRKELKRKKMLGIR